MIGIIILNYNTWGETVDCIKSILKYHSMVDKRIYVVDNNSEIKMEDYHKKFFIETLNIKLILNKENKGYSSGNNIGLKAAIEDGCHFFMICNSDIIFKDNTIDRLKISLEDLEDTAIVGPRIYNRENRFQKFFCVTTLNFSNKIKLILSHTPLKVLLKKFLESFYFYNESFDKPKKVFAVSGCCFMISKLGMEIIYPLDELSFLYNEEFIMGYKIKNSMKFTYIIPNTKVIHMQGVATQGMTPFSYTHFVNSEQLYIIKYLKINRFETGILYYFRFLIFVYRCTTHQSYKNYLMTFIKSTRTYRKEILKVK